MVRATPLYGAGYRFESFYFHRFYYRRISKYGVCAGLKIRISGIVTRVLHLAKVSCPNGKGFLCKRKVYKFESCTDLVLFFISITENSFGSQGRMAGRGRYAIYGYFCNLIRHSLSSLPQAPPLVGPFLFHQHNSLGYPLCSQNIFALQIRLSKIQWQNL